MLYILDHAEGEYALIEKSEDGQISVMQEHRDKLPAQAKDGDVLILTESGWQVDEAATRQRREQMQKRLKRLGLI